MSSASPFRSPMEAAPSASPSDHSSSPESSFWLATVTPLMTAALTASALVSL